jgi:hypothetical protein
MFISSAFIAVLVPRPAGWVYSKEDYLEININYRPP